MREPEGEGLAARVPASLAASRPRPAAACPAAAEEEERRGREKAGLGWAAAGGASCGARIALWTPERCADRAVRAERGAGTARGAEERSPESRRSPPSRLPAPPAPALCALPSL